MNQSRQARLLLAVTGASGALYAQRILDNVPTDQWEIHVMLSSYATSVINEELPGGLTLPPGAQQHSSKSMNVSFASGSSVADAMVIAPCSMGTLGRLAQGSSDDALLRCADVTLKERRPLILVPRETPIHLIHARNMVTMLEAGAVLIPASPSFYTRPQSVEAVVDTVVGRILDHLRVEHQLAPRWGESAE